MNTRKYGIDLLKSVSMLMIVTLHILGAGGLLNAVQVGSAEYYCVWLLETICMCSVNCFGLISGYVLSKGRHRYSRLFSLWVRVVLECLFVTAAFALLLPDTVTREIWIKAVFPVYHNVYWYFTAYFALFFFIPYINKAISASGKRELLVLSGSIIFLFSVLGNISPLDIFYTHGGYCFLWLMCLYVLGACFRALNIEESFNKYWLLLIFAGCILAAWAGKLIFSYDRIIGYTSPFIIAASLALLMFFRRLEFKTQQSHRFISMLSRTSFGVYIIHTNPLVWTYILTGRFVFSLNYSLPITFLIIVVGAVAIYSVCTVADWLVEKLLKLVHFEITEQKFDILSEKITGTRQKTQNTIGK